MCNLSVGKEGYWTFWELLSQEMELGKEGWLCGELTFIQQMGDLSCKLLWRAACGAQRFSSGPAAICSWCAGCVYCSPATEEAAREIT